MNKFQEWQWTISSVANILHFESILRKRPSEKHLKTRTLFFLCRHIRGDMAEPNSVNFLFFSTINIQISTSL